MYHRWIGSDTTAHVTADTAFPIDTCLQCGTSCVDTGIDAVADHETLPMNCAGTTVIQPHTFVPYRPWSAPYVGSDGRVHTVGGYTLMCEQCEYVIDETMRPSTVTWECTV
jgi:hypothetical protein